MADPSEYFEPLPPDAPGADPGEFFQPLPSLEEEAAAQNSTLKTLFDQSLTQAPDRKAGVLKLARETKAPSDAIEARYDDFKRTWEAANFDPDAWGKANPDLKKLALERPELGQLVVRDSELSVFAKALNAINEWRAPPAWNNFNPTGSAEKTDLFKPKATLFRQDLLTETVGEGAPRLARVLGARYLETSRQMDISTTQWELMKARAMRELDPNEAPALTGDPYELEKKLLDLKREAVPRDFGEGPYEQVGTDFVQALGSQVSVLKESGKLGVLGAVVGGAATRTSAGALRGASLGAKAGSALGTMRLEAGSAYGDLLEAKTDDGKPLSNLEATGGALVYGTLASAIEVAQFGIMLKSAGPLGKALAAGEAKAALVDLVKHDATFRGILARAAKGWLAEAASEGGEEGLQNLTQDAVAYFTKSLSQGKFQADSGLDAEAAMLASQKGFIGGAGMGAATSSFHVATQLVARDSARVAGAQAAAIVGMGDSPTVKAAPEAVAQMIADATTAKGEKVSSLFVDAGAFMRFFQDQNLDPAEAAGKLLGKDGVFELERALTTGGKIEVPLSDYFERWGGTETAKALADDTTTQAHHPTPREMASRDESANAEAQAMAESYRASEDAKPKEKTPDEAVFAAQVDALVAAAPQLYGKQEARTALALRWAFARTQAKAFGIDQDELFKDVRQQVAQGEMPPSASAMRQDPLPAQASSALSERLAVGDNGGPLSNEARAAELFLDPVTGLRNREGWNASPRQPGKMVAVLTLTDAKAINDAPLGGHDTTNAALRTVGHAVAAVDPEAARQGTNFIFHVDGEEGLAKALEQVRAGLPDPAMQVEAGLGYSLDKAFTKLDNVVGAKRYDKLLPPRGETRVDLSALPQLEKKFASEAVQAPVAEHLIERAATLTDEEHFRQAYQDRDVPELLSATGWNAVPRKAFVASLDLKGLKNTNLLYGKETGDKLLALFGRVAHKMGASGVDFAHLSGDEYAAQHDNRAELQAFLDDLQAELQVSSVVAKMSDGSAHVLRADFRSGIGEKTYGAADRVLNAAKRAEQQRAPGAHVRGVRAVPQGQPASQGGVDRGSVSGGDRLSDRRARAERRGLGPQAFVHRPAASLSEEAQLGGVDASFDFGANEPAGGTSKNASAYVERIRKPAKLAWARAFLDYLTGKTTTRPPLGEVTQSDADEIEKTLANEFGLADPVHGYQFDDRGHYRGPKGKPRERGAKGQEPEELRRQRLESKMNVEEWLNATHKTFYAGEPTAPRGWTQIEKDGLVKVVTIALTKTADLSTYLHESGHVFLELMGDLAERPDAPARVKQQWADALKWLGAENREGIAREHHEKWARAFEAYLLEGKAPSARLVGAFERFRLWLRDIYRNITALVAPGELNDEIRGVFDRLLATDEEIQRTQKKMGLKPLLSADDFADPTDYQAYLDEVERATSHATRQAELTAMKDRLRAQEAWWKDEESKLRDDAAEEFEILPARQAQLGLQGKAWQDGALQKLTPAPALDRKTVERMVGREAARRFNTAKDGVHPDELAEAWGYPTGQQMLEAVLAVGDKKEWAKQKAADRMAERHPDILQDSTKLREEVAKGLHGDATAAWLLRELHVLRSKAGGGPFRQAAVKRAAEYIVEGTRVAKLDAGGAMRAERSAAESAAKAAAKGDFAQALAFKQQQLLNMYLHRALSEAREEREAFGALGAALMKDKARARIGKTSRVLLGGIDKLLEGLGVSEPRVHELGLPSVPDVVREMESLGGTVMFDPEALDKLLSSAVEFWKDMTVGHMRLASDALKNIKGVAGAAGTVILDEKRADKEMVVEQIVAEIEKNLPTLKPVPEAAFRGFYDRVRSAAADLDGWLLNEDLMIEFLGGTNNLDSVAMRALWFPLKDAKAKEAQLLGGPVRAIIGALDSLPNAVRERLLERVDGKALFPDWTIENKTTMESEVYRPNTLLHIAMMLLNSGNEGNLKRLLEGYGITKDQLDAALRLLPKEVFEWAQRIWDAIEQLRDPAFDLEERQSGLRPEAVVAAPVVTPHGTYQGGYFPLVYNRVLGAGGEKQVSAMVQAVTDPTYTRPGTPHGYTKGRTEYVGGLSLNPAVIQNHIAQVAHDIAFREPLQSVAALLLDPKLRAALQRGLGDERQKYMLGWLKDIAGQRSAEALVGGAFHGFVKSNLVRAALAYAPSNALEDLSNLMAVLPATQLKSKHLAAGLAEFSTHPVEAMRRVEELSPDMRARHDEVTTELRRKVAELTKKQWAGRTLAKLVSDHSFDLMEFSGRATESIIWLGAHRQFLMENPKEADTGKAVRFADHVVNSIYASHSPVNQSAIMRNKGYYGMVLVFYGFLNKSYNSVRRTVHDIHTAEGFVEKAQAARPVATKLLGYAMAAFVVSEFLRGRGPETDDGDTELERWVVWALRKMAFGWFGLFPHGGDVQAAADTWFQRSVNTRSLSLSVIGLSGMYSAAKIAKMLGEDGDGELTWENSDKILRELGNIQAPLLGLPSNQLNKTVGYSLNRASGEAEARNALDDIGGAIYGDRKGHPSNIFTVWNDLAGDRR